MPIIEGTGLGTPIRSTGAPSGGTSEIQTITIGGTPTGGTFTLTFEGNTTAPIPWVNVNATLLANIQTALEGLPNLDPGDVLMGAGSLAAGIGACTVTFAGNRDRLDVAQMTATNNLTGTSPTVAVTTTTPGVTATGRGSPVGALAIDSANGKLYINTGGTLTPTWTVVGSQT